MTYLGIANIMMFFVIVGVAVIFIVIWIMKSEARVNLAKDQIKTLRARLESGERERYMLSEMMSDLASSQPAPMDMVQVKSEPEAKDKEKGVSKKKLEESLKDREALTRDKEALEAENKGLKIELEEAKSSLAEVYKALCEK